MNTFTSHDDEISNLMLLNRKLAAGERAKQVQIDTNLENYLSLLQHRVQASAENDRRFFERNQRILEEVRRIREDERSMEKLINFDQQSTFVSSSSEKENTHYQPKTTQSNFSGSSERAMKFDILSNFLIGNRSASLNKPRIDEPDYLSEESVPFSSVTNVADKKRSKLYQF